MWDCSIIMYSKSYNTKNIEGLIICCWQSHRGKFFDFHADGSYGDNEYVTPELFLLLMTSLFTFRYHFLSFSCYWCWLVPYIYLTSPHIFLPFITLHLTLPYLISPFVTLTCTLPYLTFCLTLLYLTFCLSLPYLTLHLTIPYFLPYLTISLTLHFALPYLTS